jgi:hypothetical protein
LSRAARVALALLLSSCSGLLDLPDDPEVKRAEARRDAERHRERHARGEQAAPSPTPETAPAPAAEPPMTVVPVAGTGAPLEPALTAPPDASVVTPPATDAGARLRSATVAAARSTLRQAGARD